MDNRNGSNPAAARIKRLRAAQRAADAGQQEAAASKTAKAWQDRVAELESRLEVISQSVQSLPVEEASRAHLEFQLKAVIVACTATVYWVRDRAAAAINRHLEQRKAVSTGDPESLRTAAHYSEAAWDSCRESAVEVVQVADQAARVAHLAAEQHYLTVWRQADKLEAMLYSAVVQMVSLAGSTIIDLEEVGPETPEELEQIASGDLRRLEAMADLATVEMAKDSPTPEERAAIGLVRSEAAAQLLKRQAASSKDKPAPPAKPE